jgi:hypothetical protein
LRVQRISLIISCCCSLGSAVAEIIVLFPNHAEICYAHIVLMLMAWGFILFLLGKRNKVAWLLSDDTCPLLSEIPY